MKKLILILTFFAIAFSGCEKNPAGSLMYNGVDDSDSSWADPFVLYINGDIRTRVVPFDDAIGAYTNIWEKYGNLGNQLEARYNGVSYSGHMSMKMTWSGAFSETYDSGSTANNVNFWLTTTNGKTGDTKDLTAGGYNKISFWYKTELRSHTEVIINVFGHGYPSEDVKISVSADWTYAEVDISGYSTSAVNSYISVTMRPDSTAPVDAKSGLTYCDGGTIYLDDIRLSK
ncbi:MAG: hypothetical protein LBL00_05075 [Endomicrobium sp.]|jgi:hypothetical protein|nr:hypothetical protein [Endomicrobium sp.]